MKSIEELASDFASDQAEKLAFNALKLPDAVRQVYLVNGLTFKVANSGFQGWIESHNGNFAPETLQALLEMGAVECADTVRRALAVFPKSKPSRDPDEREDFLADSDIPESFWEELDKELLKQCEKENLDGLFKSYVQKHAKVFKLGKTSG